MSVRKHATTQLFAVEWNGESWQSVFPSPWAEYSQTHTSVTDALTYMVKCIEGIASVDVPQPLDMSIIV